MLCDLRPAEKPLTYRCTRCGYAIRFRRAPLLPIHHTCRVPERRSTLGRFGVALVRHALNLFRRRTPWEIAELHAICRGCDFYRPSRQAAPRSWWQRLLRIEPADGSCTQCGCRIDRRSKWLNKLAWRSESCPAGYWPAQSLWRWLCRKLLRREGRP